MKLYFKPILLTGGIGGDTGGGSAFGGGGDENDDLDLDAVDTGSRFLSPSPSVDVNELLGELDVAVEMPIEDPLPEATAPVIAIDPVDIPLG